MASGLRLIQGKAGPVTALLATGQHQSIANQAVFSPSDDKRYTVKRSLIDMLGLSPLADNSLGLMLP